MLRRLFLIVAVLVLAAALYAVGTALAAKINVKIKGGPLSLTPSADQAMNDVILDGNDTIATGTLGELQVKDARGTGAGWIVIVRATDFTEQSDPLKTIPATGFSIPAAPVVTVIAGSGGVSSGSGILKIPGIVLLDSPSPDGRGRYSITPDLELDIPAEVFVGTYASTVTETILSY